MAESENAGLVVAPHAVTVGNAPLIVRLAARHRLPAVYSDRYFVESGGLLSFGNNTADMFQRSASYIDRVLKGAKPADLPIQLPTKFELIINLKTARELSLHVPSMMLLRADRDDRIGVMASRWPAHCAASRPCRLRATAKHAAWMMTRADEVIE